MRRSIVYAPCGLDTFGYMFEEYDLYLLMVREYIFIRIFSLVENSFISRDFYLVDLDEISQAVFLVFDTDRKLELAALFFSVFRKKITYHELR